MGMGMGMGKGCATRSRSYAGMRTLTAAAYLWRSEFSNEAARRLHAEALGHRLVQDDC